MSIAGGRIAYTRVSEYRPADVAIVDRGGKPRSLTDLNANLLGHRRLGKVEEMRVKSSADGREVEAWIVTPPDFDALKKYPLMLEIHGGPFANYGPRFAPETQLYAAHGYIVVYANPRGSDELRQRVREPDPERVPGQRLRRSDERRRRGDRARLGRHVEPVRHRRQRRRRADGVDRRPQRPLPRGGRREAGDQLVQLRADHAISTRCSRATGSPACRGNSRRTTWSARRSPTSAT